MSALSHLCQNQNPKQIVHLAAQAGVRYSIENPAAYVHSNLVGHSNMLELARQFGVAHMVYASSSSVYGGNSEVPFSESQQTDNPVSFYGATKKANEVLANSYAHLYGKLGDFIALIEGYMGQEAEKIMKPMQDGDVVQTWANIDYAKQALGYKPKTSLKDGLKTFIDWYKDYHAL